MRKQTASRESLIEALETIGWSTRGKYPNERVIDHRGENTYFRVLSDRVEVDCTGKGTAICFHYKGSGVEKIAKDTVSLGTKDCFVLFMNHDLPASH